MSERHKIARVTVWSAAGARLKSYTCPVPCALESALADVKAAGDTGYATINHLDGTAWYRVPERDGVEKPSDPKI